MTKERREAEMANMQDIYSVTVSSDGMYVASGGGDKAVRVWDMSGIEIVNYWTNAGVTGVRFFTDQRFLVFGCMDGTVKIINWREGSLVANLQGHTADSYGIDVLPKSGNIVSAGLDKKVLMWSRPKSVDTFPSHLTAFDYPEKALTRHEVCL